MNSPIQHSDHRNPHWDLEPRELDTGDDPHACWRRQAECLLNAVNGHFTDVSGNTGSGKRSGQVISHLLTTSQAVVISNEGRFAR